MTAAVSASLGEHYRSRYGFRSWTRTARCCSSGLPPAYRRSGRWSRYQSRSSSKPASSDSTHSNSTPDCKNIRPACRTSYRVAG